MLFVKSYIYMFKLKLKFNNKISINVQQLIKSINEKLGIINNLMKVMS